MPPPHPPKWRNSRKRRKARANRQNALRTGGGGGVTGGADGYFGRETAAASRAQNRAYYRQLGATKEWAENNYYHLRITQQDGALIPVSGFWRDYAKWTADGAQGAFVSPNVAEASHNFAEMMLALAVLDLPFDAPKHDGKTAAGQFTLTAGGPVIVFHKEVKPSVAAGRERPAGATARLAEFLPRQRPLSDGRQREVREICHLRIPHRHRLWRQHRGDQPDQRPGQGRGAAANPARRAAGARQQGDRLALGPAGTLHHQDLRVLLLFPRHRRG